MAKMDELLASMYEDFKEANASQSDPSAEEVISALEEGKAKFESMTSEEVLAYDKDNPIEGLFR